MDIRQSEVSISVPECALIKPSSHTQAFYGLHVLSIHSVPLTTAITVGWLCLCDRFDPVKSLSLFNKGVLFRNGMLRLPWGSVADGQKSTQIVRTIINALDSNAPSVAQTGALEGGN